MGESHLEPRIPHDINRLTVLTISDLSDEHQSPVILGVRVDGLDELGYRTSHQVGLVDLVGVTDGGHLFFEDDG